MLDHVSIGLVLLLCGAGVETHPGLALYPEPCPEGWIGGNWPNCYYNPFLYPGPRPDPITSWSGMSYWDICHYPHTCWMFLCCTKCSIVPRFYPEECKRGD